MTWFIGMLIGIIIGLIGGVLIDRDTVNKYYNKIRKVKVKGDGNTVTDLISSKELREKQKEERQLLRQSKKPGKG